MQDGAASEQYVGPDNAADNPYSRSGVKGLSRLLYAAPAPHDIVEGGFPDVAHTCKGTHDKFSAVACGLRYPARKKKKFGKKGTASYATKKQAWKINE